ncbi:MAG: cupin, partial [Halomonas sp.]|nr:cupin [Halomonas sp.]
YVIGCAAGDLISVPAGTPHWFDMGPEPNFMAIRLFTDSQDWVARMTGSDIASRFPRYEVLSGEQAA